MKKNTKIAVGILIIVLILVGIICLVLVGGSKKAITIEQFAEKAKESGYTIAETTDKDKEDSPVKDAKVAVKDDYSYLIKFYELKDEQEAKKRYDENKTKFEQNKKEEDAPTENNKKNYAYYTLKSNGKYNYTARIGNTVVDITANEDKEQEVKEFIKKLGY